MLAHLFALALSLPIATEPAGDKVDFQKGLDQVGELVKARRWKTAREQLLKLIDAHAGEDAVRAKLPLILDDLKQSMFWLSHKEPDPHDLTAGELLAFDRMTDTVKLRYRPDEEKRNPKAGTFKSRTLKLPELGDVTTAVKDAEGGKGSQLGDFVEQGWLSVHPLQFCGPYTIEIKGSAYFESETGQVPPAPTVVVFVDSNEWFALSLGYPRVTTAKGYGWRKPVLVHGKDKESKVLDLKPDSPLNLIDSYAVAVNVGAGTISMRCNGKELFNAKKSPKAFGWIGLGNFPGIEEITISGKSYGAWIDGLIDAAAQKDWDLFLHEYDVQKDLPEWLRSTPAAAASAAQPVDNDRLPPEFAAGTDLAHWNAVIALMHKGDPKAVSDLLQTRKPGDISEDAAAYLQCLLDIGLDQNEEALKPCEALCARFMPMLELRLIRVRLYARCERRAEAIAEARKMIDDFKGRPQPWVQLASLLIADRRASEANALVERALTEGIAAKDLETVTRTLLRVTKGPQWRKTERYETKHYEVLSDMDRQTCTDVALTLEDAWTYYSRHFVKASDASQPRFKSYVFSGKDGFTVYAEDLITKMHKNTAGLFIPVLQQLLLWNLPDRAVMLQTVRHEGFHQFLDRFVSAPPVWLNEGLAEYYENLSKASGAWVEGGVHREHVQTLLAENHKWISISELIWKKPATFYADAHTSYATAWAFVHFLQNSGDAHRKLFDDLIRQLIDGTDAATAQHRVFDAVDLQVLWAELKRYVQAL